MKVWLSLTIGAVALASGSPAHACRSLVASAKAKYSDVIVVGQARCLDRPGHCVLSIERVIKGQSFVSGSEVDISVDIPPPSTDDDHVITIRCPQAFEPWQPEIEGRFYLKVRDDGSLFAAFPIDPKFQPALTLETTEVK